MSNGTTTVIKAATCIDIARAAGLSGGIEKSGEVYFNAPYRDDKNPSLRINIEKNLWCDDAAGRGGNYWDLIAAILDVDPNDKPAVKAWLNEHGLSNGNGTKPDRRIVATYDYRNIEGDPVFQVIRYEPKGFSQRRPDGNGGCIHNLKGVDIVPYRLDCFHDKETVFIVEGERHADLLWDWGIPGTTNPMGAGKWREEFNRHFAGKNVAILPDNDEVGRKHALDVAGHLLPVAIAVKIVELPGLPEKGDIVDWVEAGHEKKELFELVTSAEPITVDSIPDPEVKTPESESAENVQQEDSEHSLPFDWPEPQPIKPKLLPVEPLPPEVIPTPFRGWLTDIADRMQAPLDFVATAAMVVAGAVIGAGCGIRPKRQDDWLVIPNLWGAAVGRPSIVLKTPSLSEAMKPIARMEIHAKEDFDQQTSRYEAEEVMFKASQSAITDEMKRAVKNGSGEEDALIRRYTETSEPNRPTWRRFKTNDSTVEKMSELLAENPRGMFLFRDELIGLLRTWDKDGRENDRAFFLEAWNGYGDNHSDRIGRGTTFTQNMCISIFGGIQPDKLTIYLHGAMKKNDNDGLTQRFQMITYPDEPKNWKLVDRTPNVPARERAFAVIEKLADAEFTEWGAVLDEGGKTPYFHFDESAQEMFFVWLTELQGKLEKDDEPIVTEHLGKYRSLMPSLALIFHLIDIADGATPGPVCLACTERAAAMCDYLESHARRVYGLVGNKSRQAAAHLVSKIKAGKLKDGFTGWDVRRKEWSLLDGTDLIRMACEELAEAGWLREFHTPAAFGQKPKTEYFINPAAMPGSWGISLETATQPTDFPYVVDSKLGKSGSHPDSLKIKTGVSNG